MVSFKAKFFDVGYQWLATIEALFLAQAAVGQIAEITLLVQPIPTKH